MNPFKKKHEKTTQALILDTCGVIDGRIVDIARAGFVPQHIIIPQFIIAELQFLADNGDAHKRERARHGLDVVRSLQDLRRTEISIAREQFKNIKEVDDKLVALAKQRGAMLYTTDYNLNKVAQIEGVVVLNVNELAQALRPRRLPGERIELKITQVGQDKTQGVGYLDDGTMVVVEKAGSKVGQRLTVEFSRMLQTQAGKMMFAVLPASHGNNNKPQPTIHKKETVSSAISAPEKYTKPAPSNESRNSATQVWHSDHQQPHRTKPAPARAPKVSAKSSPRQAAKPTSKKPANATRRRKHDIEDSLLQAINDQD